MSTPTSNPAKPFIPYGRQDISGDDIAAVEAVLRSDYLTQGPAVPAFEAAQAAQCGARFAVAMNSATSALHTACLALGLGPGGRLWTSPNTFVASANCALYCGAAVDFVDINPATLNLCPQLLAAKLAQAETDGTLPDIVVPVHFAGLPCDMAAIRALSRRYGFKVLEDASHAVGATYQGVPVGACEFSDICIFSYHPVKIVTTGEGGMALTQDPVLARRLQLLRSHGITRETPEMEEDSHGPWYYQQTSLGFNYRMTELQAALGSSQLNRLDAFITRRRELAAEYRSRLAGLPLHFQVDQPGALSAWHLFVIRLDDASRRLAVFNALRAASIGVNVHYIPVHTQPHYRRLGFRDGQFPDAEAYYAGAISLPMFPALSDADFNKIIYSIRSCI